jgi:peptide subunit release factor 1 (eRF1)
MQKYGNKIILMGVDAGGKNVMTLYDTDDNSELAMITAQDDIEVYHAEHSSTGNTIIFDGQRKSDGKYVTGAFDLDTAKLSVKVIGNAALLDLAAFR